MENKVLIYLDFDGVLTTKFSTHSKYHIGLQFDSMCVNNLKRILKELRNNFEKVVIVVISDWRYDMSNEQLEKMLFDVYGDYGHRILPPVTSYLPQFAKEFTTQRHCVYQP